MATDSLDELSTAVLGPSGRLGEVIADAPRLTHSVQALECDRRALLAAMTARAAADRHAEEQLAQRLTAYRQRTADVLHQAYGVDLGGET
ncbi:hypothetical protein [Catellatospora citrea]|uniref:Uncharacterized protein n=1 Tax=Catellatospora citrea TaxID=53366 RepID=A0A8J3KE14_9ACTN|nr:hypothetical protein [Catellatospora citrea]RKE07960.1 hypothetical protein C8E86_2802 [Catellatospora citrea]GIF98341.1 hypothetical protein Cci01nite_34350 [Catellatospora citrea]